MNELALFAGAGGGILGGKLLGWRTVCAVERDAYAAQVLAARQNDGSLPAFPIWSDVRSFDGRPWNGIIDVVSGGFPCQDISNASNGAGIAGGEYGQAPDQNDHIPNWPASERTHYMMYEDTSEGTPISPAFETPEELARWLADTGASLFGSNTASYEGWLRVAKGWWAPSAVSIGGGPLVNGVDAL